MEEPGTTGYQPFPPIADWTAADVDLSSFDGYAAVLEALRRDGAGALARAVDFATRAAAIDTGAIEGLYEVDRGFTFTVAHGVAAWEKVIAAREPVVRRSFEDALKAYDYVLDLATARTELSEMAIRQIHEIICAGQETYRVWTSVGWQNRPLQKGRYKDDPNNPTNRRTGEVHSFAPPIDVPAEMGRLVTEMRSKRFTAAHPVLQAAWAHYAFVAVHPFPDGNGRVARALASVFLYRRPGVPLVIFADQKGAYLDALEEADAGRPEPLALFVLGRVGDVIGLAQVSALGSAPPTSASVDDIRQALAQAKMPNEELAAIGDRLLSAVYAELRNRMTGLGLPEGVRLSVQNKMPMVGSAKDGDGRLLIELSSDSPADATLSSEVSVRTIISDDPPHFSVDSTSLTALTVNLADAFPVFTGVLEIKLRLWVDGLLNHLLAILSQRIRQTLIQRGLL